MRGEDKNRVRERGCDVDEMLSLDNNRKIPSFVVQLEVSISIIKD